MYANADVLELVDEADSKSVVSDGVWVRVPPSAPFYTIKSLKYQCFRDFIFAFGVIYYISSIFLEAEISSSLSTLV